jgi:hypothetical protein
MSFRHFVAYAALIRPKANWTSFLVLLMVSCSLVEVPSLNQMALGPLTLPQRYITISYRRILLEGTFLSGEHAWDLRHLLFWCQEETFDNTFHNQLNNTF